MTAAVYRTTELSLSVPQTQNTAPVLEFNCLYTHDIRRKQKRWQDGFLRFHTFNKRVMVYDVPRNFIGDTHWKADEAVQDGDEVTLEKDGVMVQVAESVGRTETDLTELRRSKKKGSSDHGSSPARAAQTPVTRRASGMTQETTQLRHRSLNALLGTPKGPLGKAAMPTKSPFEERHADVENEEWQDGRPPKRRRIEQPASWNVTRTTKTADPAQKRETPLWARKVDAAKQKKKAVVPSEQQSLKDKKVIELSGDGEEQEKVLLDFSNDMLAPPCPPVREQTATKQRRLKPPVRSSSPAFQTQKALNVTSTTSTRPLQRETDGDIEHIPDARTAAALAKAADEKRGSEFTKEAVARRQPPCTTNEDTSCSTNTVLPPPRSDTATAGNMLRIAGRLSRKKSLLCQDQMTKKTSRTDSDNAEAAVSNLVDTTSQDSVPTKPAAKSQRKQLEQRLAKIRKRTAPVEHEPGQDHGDVEAPISEPGNATRCRAESATLAQLDQILMPSEASYPREAPLTMAPPTKEGRHLRKIVSDVARPSPPKRAPGAPVRLTPSPSKRAESPLTAMEHSAVPTRPSRTAIPVKARGKKPMQWSVSLNTATRGTSAVIFSKPFHTPTAPAAKVTEPEKPPDPWSREAFDLFTWRPPGWDEERWCVDDAHAAQETTVG